MSLVIGWYGKVVGAGGGLYLHNYIYSPIEPPSFI